MPRIHYFGAVSDSNNKLIGNSHVYIARFIFAAGNNIIRCSIRLFDRAENRGSAPYQLYSDERRICHDGVSQFIPPRGPDDSMAGSLHERPAFRTAVMDCPAQVIATRWATIEVFSMETAQPAWPQGDRCNQESPEY